LRNFKATVFPIESVVSRGFRFQLLAQTTAKAGSVIYANLTANSFLPEAVSREEGRWMKDPRLEDTRH
jgi:hypothetical protein